MPFEHVVKSIEELRDQVGEPSELARKKQISAIDAHCRAFIAHAPFVLVGTADADGRCDVSPKGGAPGFVRVLDERRLAIPDAPGNRLVYSLQNVVSSGRAGLLFLIPGLEETLRVNGRAWLTRDPAVLERLASDAKPPKIAIGVEVEEAFLHCAKAFKRSRLWQPDAWPSTEGLARPAQIWRDHMALELTTQDVQRLVDDDYADNLTWR
jgi:PPOX class probable FMN-dependent enzyme